MALLSGVSFLSLRSHMLTPEVIEVPSLARVLLPVCYLLKNSITNEPEPRDKRQADPSEETYSRPQAAPHDQCSL